MCKDIGSIYKSIFNRDLNSACLDDQICAQKVVYLIENMGIRIGDYNYVWSKYGPYSCDLQRDILNTKGSKDLNYSEAMSSALEKIKLMLDKKGAFSDRDFLELVVSLHYVKEYEFDGFCTDEIVIEQVMGRKPHLNDLKKNREVMRTVVRSLFA